MRTSNIVQESQSSREIDENSVPMTIDEDSSIFLMDAMAKLYTRPAQAVLREYLSNALDAHEAKGGSLPAIQVNLPTPDTTNAVLAIRDFGNGMDETEIASILSRYGASTKRDSNKMIGGFGLGAKSGFALTNEFFITSFQNGTRIRYRLFKDSKNKGYVEAVERTVTQEPDGIHVQIPIPPANLSELRQSVLRDLNFFLGYSLDELDLNMSATPSVMDAEAYTSLELGEETIGWISKGRTLTRRINAVIGKVSYDIDINALISHLDAIPGIDYSDFFMSLNDLRDFQRAKAINVPIGALDLPSSREGISYTERSIQTLVSVLSKYILLVKQHVQKELNSKETREEVLAYLSALGDARYSRIRDLSWRGISLPMFDETELSYYMISPVNGKNKRVITLGSGSGIREFQTLLKLQNEHRFDNGIYSLRVSSKEELAEAKALMTDEVIQAYLKSVKTSVNNDKAILFLFEEDDVLNDWIFAGESVDVTHLKAIADKLEAQKEFHRQAQLEAKLAAEKREQEELAAAKIREEGMLSSFLLEGTFASLIRKPKDKTLSSDKVTYYWSEEEIFGVEELRSTYWKQGHPLFPFILDIPTPNLYNVAPKSRILPHGDYLVSLRHFLRIFLPIDSQIVILGSEKNLAQFKIESPEIESGLLVVKDKVNRDLKKPNSLLVDVFDILRGQKARPAFEVLNNLMKFIECLTNEEKDGKLSDDVKVVTERLSALKFLFENEKGWSGIPLQSYTDVLTDIDISRAEQNLLDDIEQLIEKYPLLMEGTFRIYSDRLKQDMFNYINIQDSCH